MATALLFNRVRVATATTGTGTVTLGAKVSNKYATFAEGGVANTNVVTYTIEDGDDWEIGRGTYTSAGTTLSRDTVLISSVAGTVGTSKLDLSGTATVFITAAKEDLDVNDFTEKTAPLGETDFVWGYDVATGLKKKFKPLNMGRTGGMQLLASGTVAAATLDIVLTSYTAYRGFRIILSGFRPATDTVGLYARFSTDGGSSYDATGYSYAGFAINDAAGTAAFGAAANQIQITNATTSVGSDTTEGIHVIVDLLNQTSTAFYSRITWQAVWHTNGVTLSATGAGVRETAQDTDAIRFLFSSGDISAGNYAVYGYA